MTQNPPPLPPSVRRALRRFSAEQVTEAKQTLAGLARGCPDPKVRKECAQYIVDMSRNDEAQYFAGDPDALTALSTVPVAQQAAFAMQLFAQGRIARIDLDTILRTVATDQTAKIAELERGMRLLEAENQDLDAQLRGEKIDTAKPSEPAASNPSPATAGLAEAVLQ